MKRVVIVGGSLAGVEAAVTLREQGYDGQLTLVGNEPGPPYERYPLSKEFLVENLDRAALALPSSVAPDVDVRCAEAVDLDHSSRMVALRGGERLPFDGLVIATGSRPQRLAGFVDEDRIFSYRTFDEASAVRAALADSPTSVVVVGGGLIGSEIASAVSALGLRATIVDSSPLPLERTLGHQVASHLQARHQDRGVRVLSRTRVVGAKTPTGRVRRLELDSGELLDADLVIVAAGTRPNVEWLRSSGLDLHDGVRCTTTLHAVGSAGVVAAGDVARTAYPLLDGDVVRVEHWRNAMEQARRAASNLLLGPRDARPFDATPCYSTKIHGQAIRVVGFPQYGDESAVTWGSVESGSFVVTVGRRRRLVGMLAVNTDAVVIRHYTELVEASARDATGRLVP